MLRGGRGGREKKGIWTTQFENDSFRTLSTFQLIIVRSSFLLLLVVKYTHHHHLLTYLLLSLLRKDKNLIYPLLFLSKWCLPKCPNRFGFFRRTDVSVNIFMRCPTCYSLPLLPFHGQLLNLLKPWSFFSPPLQLFLYTSTVGMCTRTWLRLLMMLRTKNAVNISREVKGRKDIFSIYFSHV